MSDDEFGQKSEEKTPSITDGSTPLLTRVFRTLATQRRRYILYYLREHEQAATDELAAQIAAWEQDSSRQEVAAADIEQVKMTLVHSHLPQLEDYGLIEYDHRSETVCYTYPPGLLDDALDLTATLEHRP